MDASSVFHTGELALQARFGELEVAARNGRAISDSIMRGAWRFVGEQSSVVLATLDAAGAPRTSFVIGEPGFATVSEPRKLEIALARSAPGADPDLSSRLARGGRVATLFLEFSTRRRFRVNGRPSVVDDVLIVDVDEAFPNCPKYIQGRSPLGSLRAVTAAHVERTSEQLAPHQLERVRAADTFFLATSAPRGVDASHRGGRPGFITATPQRLVVPDYVGNHMYTTLGNLELDARASLLFVDFGGERRAHDEPRTELELEGTVTLTAQSATPFDATGGTGRWWTFDIQRVRERTCRTELAWSEPEPSPHNPSTRPLVLPR